MFLELSNETGTKMTQTQTPPIQASGKDSRDSTSTRVARAIEAAYILEAVRR